MMRLLIYVILFYIIWKFIKVFVKYLSSSKKENPDIKSGREGQFVDLRYFILHNLEIYKSIREVFEFI